MKTKKPIYKQTRNLMCLDAIKRHAGVHNDKRKIFGKQARMKNRQEEAQSLRDCASLFKTLDKLFTVRYNRYRRYKNGKELGHLCEFYTIRRGLYIK